MTEKTPTGTESGPLRAVLLVGAISEYGFGQFVIRELVKSRHSFSRIGVYLDLNRDNAAKAPFLERLKQAGIEVVQGKGFESLDFFIRFRLRHEFSWKPWIATATCTDRLCHCSRRSSFLS